MTDAPGQPDTPNKPDRPEPGPNRAPGAARWLLPPAASLALHTGLAVALAAVTIEVTRDRPPDRPARVTLAAPASPPPIQRPSTPATATPAAADEPSGPATTPQPAPEPKALTAAVADIARVAPRAAAPTLRANDPVADAISRDHNAGAPRVRFADIDAAPARTVVFVVDASGAVATAFTFVREELLRSIDQLSPTQRFQIVVFPGPGNSEPVLAPINHGRLAIASPKSKRAAAEWMETFRPRGQSAPLAGLRMALGLKPDIALLITRSIERTGPDAAWGAGLEGTIAELDRLNPVDRRNGLRPTSIAAIQLLDEDPTGIMPAIAAIHGSGVSDYRVVTAESLITPQEPPARAAGATDANAIDAAAAILADLDDAGTALRLFHGLADGADRTAALDQSRRARSLAERTPGDPRARVLIARARSMSLEPADLRAAIESLDAELLHDADADTWRRLAIIDALAALQETDEAVARLTQLTSDADEIGVSDALRARLITTRIALGNEPDDPESLLRSEPFVDDTGNADPYWILAVAEAQVRARLRSQRPDAIAPLVDLLARAEREQAMGWVPILTDRIARAAEIDARVLDDAPARARLLAAESWSRSPQRRPQAVAILKQLAATASPQQPDALWLLAVLERSQGTDASTAAAGDHLATLAQRFPDHPRAPDALAGAISITTDPAQLRPLLKAATQRLADRPEIDLWRYRLAELSTGPERLATLETITPGTREATLARALYAETAETLLASSPDRAGLLERAAGFLARHSDPGAYRWLDRAARAHIKADPAKAVALAEQATSLTPPDAHEPAITLAESLIANNQSTPAAERLAALATRLDAGADRSEAFWHAWTLLLEIASPDDPASARAHLARLELIDPQLGGEPWRTRLRTLKASLPTR